METIKWSEKVNNEQVLERIEEKRTLLNNILCIKAKWIGHNLRINCLLYDAIEGQMMEVTVLGRSTTQLLDGMRNRRRCWEPKEEAEDRKRWKRQVIYEPTEEIPVIFLMSMDILISNIIIIIIMIIIIIIIRSNNNNNRMCRFSNEYGEKTRFLS